MNPHQKRHLLVILLFCLTWLLSPEVTYADNGTCAPLSEQSGNTEALAPDESTIVWPIYNPDLTELKSPISRLKGGLQLAATADGFDYPVAKPNGDGYNVTAGCWWLQRTGLCAPGPHPGQDFNKNCGGDCELGEPVYAVANGVVVDSNYYGVWGNVILIEHTLPDGSKVWSQYAHLRDRKVGGGTVVNKGHQIGTIGKGANNRFYAHLHFEIRIRPLSANFWPSPDWSDDKVREYYTHPSNFINDHRKIGPPPECNPNSDQIAVYEHAGFGGQCVVKGIGEYSNPGAIGLPNDCISSIKVGGNVKAILCRHDNYGECWEFSSDNGDLGQQAIGGDQVSSLKVVRRQDPSPECNPNSDQVSLYEHGDYGGQCVTKGIGQYGNPGAIGLPNDSITSLKVGGNVKAILCRDDNYGGGCWEFTSNTRNLTQHAIGNDQVSSVKVEKRNTNHAPRAPSLSDPHNWAVTTNQAPTLRWRSNGDPDNDSLQFYCEVYQSAVNANSGWISGTSWRPSKLDRRYHGYSWRVKAKDSHGAESGWSETWHFNIEAPTATYTPRPTRTNTPRPTATYTPRPTRTNTPRPTRTNTPRPTRTNTPWSCNILAAMDHPAANGTVTGAIDVTGWALDANSRTGTGVDAVEVWVDGRRLGRATYGGWRQDIANGWGARYGRSGYTYRWDTRTVGDGQHTLGVRCLGACGWTTTLSRQVTVSNSRCQVVVAVDGPAENGTVGQSATIAGWALDLGSGSGNGVDQVGFWLDGPRGQGTHLGATNAFHDRPDLGFLPAHLRRAGYRFTWNTAGVSSGAHTLYVYGHGRCGWEGLTTRRVQVTGNPSCQMVLFVDQPGNGASASGQVTLSGWTVDLRNGRGTGVDRVGVWLDGPRGQGIRLGQTDDFSYRPDIANLLGSRYSFCGYRLSVPLHSVSGGAHTLYVQPHSPECGWGQATTRRIVVTGNSRPTATPTTGAPRLRVEAESGQHTAPMRVGSAGSASGGSYIYTPLGTTGEGRTRLRVHVPQSGRYYLWGLASGKCWDQDSFNIEVDGGQRVQWGFDCGGGWTWDYVCNLAGNRCPTPSSWYLSAGWHNIDIITRERGAKLDAIELTTASVEAYQPG